MAKDEGSFVLPVDLIYVLELMTDKLAGQFIKYILSYVKGEELQPANRIIEIAFIPVRQLIDEYRNKNNPGALHWNWKGGVTPINRAIRNGTGIREWRNIVLKRDLFTCQRCGDNKPPLHVHHIIPFSENHELRVDPNNGITLCKNCHRYMHKKGGSRG